MYIEAPTKTLAISQTQGPRPLLQYFTHQAGSTMPHLATSTGADQPPRNIIAAIVDSRIMFAYSPRKNIAKPIPEYSTMWPATISDSPSTTSNGWRFVSATAEIT